MDLIIHDEDKRIRDAKGRAGVAHCEIVTPWRYDGGKFRSMKRKTKTRRARAGGGRWLLAAAVALFVLLLLVRMIAFVAGHGHHY